MRRVWVVLARVYRGPRHLFGVYASREAAEAKAKACLKAGMYEAIVQEWEVQKV